MIENCLVEIRRLKKEMIRGNKIYSQIQNLMQIQVDHNLLSNYKEVVREQSLNPNWAPTKQEVSSIFNKAKSTNKIS